MKNSNIYGVGVGWSEIQDVVGLVGCNPRQLPFTYLGLPIALNMGRKSAWVPVIEISTLTM